MSAWDIRPCGWQACFEAGIGTPGREGGGDEGAGCRIAIAVKVGHVGPVLKHLELGLTAALLLKMISDHEHSEAEVTLDTCWTMAGEDIFSQHLCQMTLVIVYARKYSLYNGRT
jgi:hypothetical protein